jgi:hypothetical protein
VLDEPRTIGETLDIGSGDIRTYEDLMRICAEELGLPFRNVSVPVLTPRLSSYWLHLVTSVDMRLARPLIEGLRSDVVCHDHRIREWLPRDLSSYRLAVQRALAKDVPNAPRESRWTDAQRASGRTLEQHRTRVRMSPKNREFRDYRYFDSDLSPDALYSHVTSIGGEAGYGRRVDGLWRVRGAIDRMLGGPGLRRGRPRGRNLAVGDPIDFWRVERIEPGEYLRLVAEMRVPGVAHLEFRIEPRGEGGSRLHQLATLENASIWSGLYWKSIAPLHDAVFNQLGEHVLTLDPEHSPQP